MKRKIAVLGSTGSIGKNAINVIEKFRDKFELVAVSAQRNHGLIIEQIKKFNVKYAAIGTEEGYKEIKAACPEVTLFLGEEGLKQIAKEVDYDVILTAVMGAVGIEATVEAVKREKTIALANKETMVAAGKIINGMLNTHRAKIIPVDSEHSALFQALASGKSREVRRLILTASGGPFRGYTKERLKSVTREEALKHPKWTMGSKITIDSATLVNKGLEVIEAHYLFNMPYEKIDVVVHPQSIIHSMVEFCDRSVIAQLGNPDMRIPIQYAFTYPERLDNDDLEQLDFFKLATMSFEKPDMETFAGLKFAFEAGKRGESMPAVFNAANEEAVGLFLEGGIEFLDIYNIIEKEMSEHVVKTINSVEDIIGVDKIVRERILSRYR